MNNMTVGCKHISNNYGEFKIVKYINCNEVVVEFIATGAVVTAKADNIRNKKIKDPLARIIYNVGFIGIGRYKTTIDGEKTKVHITWHHMFERCYCSKRHRRQHTYEDCTVDPRWHNFQVFAEWYEENYIEGCELDKDKKYPGNKIYGPDACLFITKFENSSSKPYDLESPEGVRLNDTNLAELCREHKLDYKKMWRLVAREIDTYEGWTRFEG